MSVRKLFCSLSRSLKEVDKTSGKTQGAVDMKVDTLLTLVKQYDGSREKQAAKLSKRLESCEKKIESIVTRKPSSVPPTVKLVSGSPLQYQQVLGPQYGMPCILPPNILPPPQPPVYLGSLEVLCVEIDDSQYRSLVGTGGKVIDSVRERSGANILIKQMWDQPPRVYYKVQMTGSADQLNVAKALVKNNIAQHHFGQETDEHDNKKDGIQQ